MKNREYEQIIESQMETCVDLLISKSKEYADNKDMLHNFKVAGNLQGINSVKALAGMMAKHTVSVYDMCHSEGLFTIKQWEEKISDSINYLLILKALLIDENMLLDDTKKEEAETIGSMKSKQECDSRREYTDEILKRKDLEEAYKESNELHALQSKMIDDYIAEKQEKMFYEKVKEQNEKVSKALEETNKQDDCSGNCNECAYLKFRHEQEQLDLPTVDNDGNIKRESYAKYKKSIWY